MERPAAPRNELRHRTRRKTSSHVNGLRRWRDLAQGDRYPAQADQVLGGVPRRSAAAQYSEGCFATWDTELQALIATATGSARPVDKRNITPDMLAVIVGIRPDGRGALVRHVEGRGQPAAQRASLIAWRRGDVPAPPVTLFARDRSSWHLLRPFQLPSVGDQLWPPTTDRAGRTVRRGLALIWVPWPEVEERLRVYHAPEQVRVESAWRLLRR